MDDKQEGPPERPAFLNTLLNASKRKVQREDEAYAEFLQEAEVANTQLLLSRYLAINTTGAIIGLSHRTNIGKPSLETIFYFYTRIQSPAAQLGIHAPTYDDILWANNTMSLMELTIFCRDFSIIPTLLSKDELRFIWRVTSSTWQSNEDQKSCKFADFSSLLVAIAVTAYNKPLMRQLLIGEYGYMPAASDLVMSLCNYLRLDDIAWVKHRIDTVGKETLASINSRSAGEVNKHAKENLRKEIAGKRLSKFMAGDAQYTQQSQKQGSPTKKIHRKKGLGHKQMSSYTNMDSDDDDDDEYNSNAQVTKVSSKMQLKTLGSTTNFADSLQAASNISVHVPLDHTASTKAILDDIFNDVPVRVDSVADEMNGVDGENGAAQENNNEKKPPLIQPHGTENIVSIQQENALLNMDLSLKHLLDPFTQMKGNSDMVESSHRNIGGVDSEGDKEENPHYIQSGSNFLDLGVVPLRSKQVVVSVHVTNKSRDEMLFDVVVRDLDDQQAIVKVIATPIAPGLQRTIKVYLTPVVRASTGNHNILGYIDVYFKPKSHKFHGDVDYLSCPVFYRIGNKPEYHSNRKDNVKHIIPRCTVKNLPRLLNAYGI